jgi:GntP family gluconate:H+ symporter
MPTPTAASVTYNVPIGGSNENSTVWLPVAITTAAGLMLPIARNTPDTNIELLVLALGGGSMMLSHVNDGGFWIIKEYFNLSVQQTFKTWSVITSLGSLLVLALVLLLNEVL